MHSREREIAKQLLEIEAVRVRPDQPYTWTSGLRSPIYCDNRMTMSFPTIRRLIASSFAQIISEQYPEAEVIAGTATAGIAHAAWVAEELGLPMIYVRDKAKGHGRNNQIEGVLQEGQQVVVIEDLISTGKSSLNAAKAVEGAGGNVLAVMAIFSYQFGQAEEAFKEAGYPVHTLSHYTALLAEAKELGMLQEEQMEELASWRTDPNTYTEKWNQQTS